MAEQMYQEDGEGRIRQNIQETRASMSDTIDQIGAHLDPQYLKHEMKAGIREQVEETKQAARTKMMNITHQMEDTMNQTGHNIMDTVRENPVPAAMVGIGLGWLVAGGRNHASKRNGRTERDWYGAGAAVPPPYPETGYAARNYSAPIAEVDILAVEVDESGDGRQGRAENTADRAREAASEMADRTRETGQHARESASRAMDETRRKASQAKQSVRETWHETEMQARNLESRMERSIRDNPLAAGAALAAAGFAAGMMIPETDQERSLMGSARERVGEKAQQKAHEAGDKVRHIAEETTRQAQSAASDAARQEGMRL